MATYAIGDIQGCYDSLLTLLEKIQFDQSKDVLWFAGDLVNRGPDSLSTLRFVKSLGDNVITVLGNHDLHLLAIAYDVKTTRSDDMKRIINAEDSDELLHWLSHRPMLHHDPDLNFTITHAGIYPGWSLDHARKYANELEDTLQNNLSAFLQHMYGNKPGKWDDNLSGFDRLRFICNCFTRMRYCYPDHSLDFSSNGAPGTIPEGALPWFELTDRQTQQQRLLFGHWSTLGKINKENVYALDTGCVWGGELTALRIDCEEPGYISVNCPAAANPEDYIKKIKPG